MNAVLDSTTENTQNEMTSSLVRAVDAATETARQAGIVPEERRLMISQIWRNDEAIWEIAFGPKDYLRKRGGDFIIEVRASDGTVIRTVRGQ